MKQKLKNELSINWNKAFDIAKDEMFEKPYLNIILCSKYM